MAVASGDIMRVTVDANNGGSTVQQVYQMRLAAGGPLAEADVLDEIIAILETLHGLIAALLSTAYTIRSIKVVNTTQDLDVGVGVPTDTTPGTNVNNRYPPQVAFGVTFYTGVIGSRGRKFYGPVPNDVANTLGQIQAIAATPIADLITLMTADVSAVLGTYEFGIVTNTQGWKQFTAGLMSATAVTQRRRRLGVGV
jgi:hypothetical protein